MTRDNLVVASEDIQIVDGKVVISSEELACAIQECGVDLTAEEEENGITINLCWSNTKTGK